MEGKPRPDLFEKFIVKQTDQLPPEETGPEKAIKAYLRMKMKAERRKGRRKLGKHRWDPQVGNMVLVKREAVSDAIAGITKKCIHPYQGPYKITKVTAPAMYEIAEVNGKLRGVFKKSALKPYLKESEDTQET
jgi:hypothetical protein